MHTGFVVQLKSRILQLALSKIAINVGNILIKTVNLQKNVISGPRTDP